MKLFKWLARLGTDVMTVISGGTLSYKPERHYMRGPGPKYRAKHGLVPPEKNGGYFSRSGEAIRPSSKVAPDTGLS